MDDIKKLLGQRIKELRKSKKYTQEQFAEIINIDQRSLSAIECGVNFPIKNFIKIANVLDVELKDLFDFEHLELTDEIKRNEIKSLVKNLDSHDLNIIYRLIKSITQ